MPEIFKAAGIVNAINRIVESIKQLISSMGSSAVYGEIYVDNGVASQTLVTSGTFYKITQFVTNGASRETTNDAANDKIIVLKTGKYLVNVSLSFQGSVSVVYHFSIYKNGVLQPNLAVQRDIGIANAEGAISISGFCDISANDYIELYAASDGANKLMDVGHANLSITSIGANGATGATGATGSGDVIGPGANTDAYIPQWNGANSKTLKNGLAVPAGGLAGLTALLNYALVGQKMFIGTTEVAINRATAILTLDGIILTNPEIGDAKAASLRPSADGTNVFNFFKADGTTSILQIDTTNNQITLTGGRHIYNLSDASTVLANAVTQEAIKIRNTNTTANNWALIVNYNGTGSIAGAIAAHNTDHTNKYMDWVFATRAADGFKQRMVISAAGSVQIGTLGALATNATDGFLYIPTCAGTPSGTPTAYTGKCAMVMDTTNHKLYVYDGSWIAMN